MVQCPLTSFLCHVTILQWSHIFSFLDAEESCSKETKLSLNFFFSWDSQRCQNSSSTSLCCFCACIWLPWWEIYLSSWLLSAMPTSTVPCTLSLPIYPHLHLLHIYYSPPNVGRHPKPEPSHLLCMMPYTNVLLCCWWTWTISPWQHMAYDRYIAICHPLHYAALLSLKRCALLVDSWVVCNLVSVLHLGLLGLLNFCDQREISTLLLWLGTHFKAGLFRHPDQRLSNLVIGGSVIFIPFTFICVSYCLIGCTVLRICSAKEVENILHL